MGEVLTRRLTPLVHLITVSRHGLHWSPLLLAPLCSVVRLPVADLRERNVF